MWNAEWKSSHGAHGGPQRITEEGRGKKEITPNLRFAGAENAEDYAWSEIQALPSRCANLIVIKIEMGYS